MTAHKGMTAKGVVDWIKENPHKSIFVMVRIDFEKSVPCKITRHEALRFLTQVNFMQTIIDKDGHLTIGL